MSEIQQKEDRPKVPKNMPKQKSKKIEEARILGDMLYNTTFHRQWVHNTAKGMWLWNKLFFWLWIFLPVVIIAFGLYSWQIGAFSDTIEAGNISSYLLFFTIIILMSVFLTHSICVSYSFGFSFLDFFGRINRTPNKSIRGLDVIERIRTREVNLTGYITGFMIAFYLMFFIGTVPAWYGILGSTEYAFWRNIFQYVAFVFMIIFISLSIFSIFAFSFKAIWGWRFFLVIIFMTGCIGYADVIGSWIYIEDPNWRIVYEMLFYLSISGMILIFAVILIKWDVFIRRKEIRDVYIPDTVPLITPRNLFQFIRTFADPLSDINLDRRLLILNTICNVTNEEAFSKILILLHFYKKKMQIKKVQDGDKSELELTEFIEEMEEIYPYKEFDKLRARDPLYGLVLTKFEKEYYQQILNELNEKNWNDFIAWVFGIEEKNEVRLRKELWAKMDKQNQKKYLKNQEYLDMKEEPSGTTVQAYQRASKYVNEFFILIERLFISISNGMFFSPKSDIPKSPEDELDDENDCSIDNSLENLQKIKGKTKKKKDKGTGFNVEDCYFDVETSRQVFQGSYINIMALFYNYTNNSKIAKIKCIAPSLEPEELEVSFSALKKEQKLSEFIIKLCDLTSKTNPNTENLIFPIQNKLRGLPFSKTKIDPNDLSMDSYTDLLGIMTDVLKSTRVLWFRIKAKNIGDYPINVLLLDENDNVIDGKTITICINRNVIEKMRYIAGIGTAIAGATSTLSTFLTNIQSIWTNFRIG